MARINFTNNPKPSTAAQVRNWRALRLRNLWHTLNDRNLLGKRYDDDELDYTRGCIAALIDCLVYEIHPELAKSDAWTLEKQNGTKFWFARTGNTIWSHTGSDASPLTSCTPIEGRHYKNKATCEMFLPDCLRATKVPEVDYKEGVLAA